MYNFNLQGLYIQLEQNQNGSYTLEIAKKKDSIEYQGSIAEIITELKNETAIERKKLDKLIDKIKKINS